MRTALLVAIVSGLAVGALGAFGEAHFDGTLEELTSSISTWLVAPFVAGTLAPSRRAAAFVGFVTCAAELAGYYAVNPDSTAGLVVFWSFAAIVGGPVFGLAGRLTRTAAPQLKGLGVAVLAAMFIVEGVYAYVHERHAYLTGLLWITIGLGLALVATRGRGEQLRWLALTIPFGLAGEVALAMVEPAPV